jgi:two-component system, LytTR family, response regulator
MTDQGTTTVEASGEARSAPRDTLRALVIDDEPLARAHIRSLLAADPEVDIVAECGNGRDAVRAVRELEPDLVFLDIQMPELDGFEVVQAIGVDRMPVVVFVTAFDEYALRAFQVHALDYLLKPVDRGRFHEALARAKAQVARGGTGGARGVNEQLAALVRQLDARREKAQVAERLAIKVGGKILFLRVDDIDWVEAVDNHARLHVGRQAHLVRDTLTRLETRLPAGRFLRVHRSTIVNVSRIVEVQPWFQGDYVLILADGTRVTTGRSYRQKVQQFLTESS